MSRFKPIDLGIPCPSCGYVISSDDIFGMETSSRVQRLTFECPNCETANSFDSAELRSYSPHSLHLEAA